MKDFKKLLCALMALALAFALCACGGQPAETAPEETAPAAAETSEAAPDLTPWAGEYTYLCVYLSAAYMNEAFELGGTAQDIPDQCVDLPNMAGETVTLDADGAGYLDWGEDNQGPIDWWEMDGDHLRFQAGVAVIDGTIVDGLMTVEIAEGFSACFAAPGADTSGIEPISLEEYAALLTGEEAAPAEELPAEGEYTLFAVEAEGALVYSDELEMASTLTLEPDGTGVMTMDDEAMDVASWTAEAGALTIVLADDSSAEAAIHGGVIELDIWGDGSMLLVYAREGADTSAYAPMTLEEYLEQETAAPDSRLYALWESLDTEAGIHLRYDMHTDFMDADQSYEVHGKDGVYYSRRTTEVSGYKNTVVTFFRDGTAYNLYPEDMTGIVAATTSSSLIADNVLMMDDLYSDISSYARQSDYTEETRELDGVSCAVEVFPATEYTPGIAFYFDDAGQLVYCVKGAPVVESAIEIGETVYTVHAVDGAVDEGLFDISGYDITE